MSRNNDNRIVLSICSLNLKLQWPDILADVRLWHTGTVFLHRIVIYCHLSSVIFRRDLSFRVYYLIALRSQQNTSTDVIYVYQLSEYDVDDTHKGRTLVYHSSQFFHHVYRGNTAQTQSDWDWFSSRILMLWRKRERVKAIASTVLSNQQSGLFVFFTNQ